MKTIEKLKEDLIQGEKDRVQSLIHEALAAGTATIDILEKGLIAGMEVVGEKFKSHEIFLPEVLLAAQAMNAGMEILKPRLIKDGVKTQGRIVLGTVQGDIHDIGKNLVGIMLTGAGYEVIDLGNDVTPEKYLTTALEEKAGVIGMSSLLTTTMPIMKEVVDRLRSKGLSKKIKTIIGGAPVTKEYAQQIGADAYGYDALNAIEQVRKLLKPS